MVTFVQLIGGPFQYNVLNGASLMVGVGGGWYVKRAKGSKEVEMNHDEDGGGERINDIVVVQFFLVQITKGY